MKKLTKDLLTIGLVGGLALFMSGCEGKYTGGGWMDSAAEDGGKANLGFNMQASDTDGDGFADTAKGQFQYKDRGADESFPNGVSFHGVITSGSVFENTGTIEGTYTPQPKGEEIDNGTFIAYVYDEGESGASEEDSVTIMLNGGVYDTYVNSGLLKGGNIK